MAASTDRRVGGRYELVRRIARGGAGTVWAGYDHLLERDVAVKHVEIPGDLPAAEREGVRARVRSEARAAARLLHPSAVAIFDVVADDGDVHLVLELVEDPTLDERVLREGPLGEPEAARIGLGLLDVLVAAHERGIVHRDVKPSNIFVADDGRVKLTDFGIAAVEGEARLTRTGATMGSPQFIAPEQALGHPAAPEADLWGLGASLYLAVEGNPPFERGNAVATVHAVVHEPARAFARADALAPVIARLLEKEPSDRPSEPWVRDALAAIAGASGPPEAATTASPPAAAAPAVAAGPQPPPSTTAPADEEGPDPRAVSAEVPRPAPAATSSDATPPAAASSSGPPRTWMVVAAVLVLLGTVGVALLTQDAGDTTGGGDVAAPADEDVASPADGDGAPPAEDAGDAGPDTDGASDTDGAPADEEAPADDGPAAEAPDDAGTPGTGAGDDVAGEDGAEDGAVPEAEPPADWQVVDGPAYQVTVPPDWQVQPRQGRIIDHQDPGSSTYLRVDWTPDPRPDPVANWREHSAALAERFEGYEELQLTPLTFRGEPAALLEYTYTAGGTQLRAYNLNLLAGDRAYALNLQGRADRWDEVEPLFPAIVGGFEPS